MEKLCKLIKVLMAVAGALFALSLVVYYFNLDMKAASIMQPILDKWYDRRERTPLP